MTDGSISTFAISLTVDKTEYVKKSNHHRKELKKCGSDSKKLFQKIKTLTGKNVKHLPTNEDRVQLSESFKESFSMKVNKIREGVESQQHPKKREDDDKSPPCKSSFFSFRALSQDELLKAVQKMSNKFCELDPIPTGLLKACFPELSHILQYIVNTSLTSGEFPSALKHAILKPSLKKFNSDPESLKEYRPISNLSFVSKLVERVALDQLNDYLDANSLFCSAQSGYRPHHSCETLMVRMTDDIIGEMNQKNCIALLLLNLSAAFDTIDHQVLIDKLFQQYGITGSALAWFSSYLSGRTYNVRVRDAKSCLGFLLFGVPQGSIYTVQACKEECAKTEGCVAFVTAAGTNNKCYLKNKDHGAESAYGITISARMSCYEGKFTSIKQNSLNKTNKSVSNV